MFDSSLGIKSATGAGKGMERRYLKAIGIVIACAAVTPLDSGFGAETGDNKPNIVFILADDQGWNALSAPMDPDVSGSQSDYFQTPNLDKLALGGMRFAQGYSPAPLCAPTRTSIQYGISPAKTRVTSNIRPGIEEIRRYCDPKKSIASLIKKADPSYVAGHFGKWHVHGGSPKSCAYDEYAVDGGNKVGNNSTDPNDPKRTFEISQAAIRFIRKHTDAPFYLQVAYYADHLDFKASPAMLRKYREREKGKRHDDPHLAGMNEDLDRGVGMIMETLDALGIADNTYIFYTADNGFDQSGMETTPQLWAWPLSYSKGYVFEGGIRVPFIVRGPGVKAGLISQTPVVGYDLLPTFLDIVKPDFRLPDAIEGGSLLPILKNGGRGTVKRPNDFLVFHSPNCVWPSFTAFRDADLKLLTTWADNKNRLFDLSADISEQKDLSGEYPEKTREMRRRLDAYLERVDAPTITARKKDRDLRRPMRKNGLAYENPFKKKEQ